MRVFVLNLKKEPLMPCSNRKARLLLKEQKAEIYMHNPFTIRLLFPTGESKQDITLGVDTGYSNVGLSATTVKEELWAEEVILRNDISSLLKDRASLRRTRRARKTRYRKARWLNRVSRKKKGWLAPSIQHKVDTHIRLIDNVHKFLPISKIIVEIGQFDIQRINNPNIQPHEFSRGVQYGFSNVREYVLTRDSHTYKICKAKNTRLEVHHIIYRSQGGTDTPDNLLTVCSLCHRKIHENTLKITARHKKHKTSTFMNILRPFILTTLKEKYRDVSETYGYITKQLRIDNGIIKTHYNDAFCISQNINARQLNNYIKRRQVRKQNRQIHKLTIGKDGKRKLNQSPFIIKDFRLFDKVLFNNIECFIFGRRATGYFDLRLLNGISIHKSASYNNLRLLQKRTGMIWAVESKRFLPRPKGHGFPRPIGYEKEEIVMLEDNTMKLDIEERFAKFQLNIENQIKEIKSLLEFNGDIDDEKVIVATLSSGVDIYRISRKEKMLNNNKLVDENIVRLIYIDSVVEFELSKPITMFEYNSMTIELNSIGIEYFKEIANEEYHAKRKAMMDQSVQNYLFGDCRAVNPNEARQWAHRQEQKMKSYNDLSKILIID